MSLFHWCGEYWFSFYNWTLTVLWGKRHRLHAKHKFLLHAGHRLRNFEIRVGIDGEELGNNSICYERLESMEAGMAEKFTCYEEIFGNWISINKTEATSRLRFLHFQEIRVFGELSKLIFVVFFIHALPYLCNGQRICQVSLYIHIYEKKMFGELVNMYVRVYVCSWFTLFLGDKILMHLCTYWPECRISIQFSALADSTRKQVSPPPHSTVKTTATTTTNVYTHRGNPWCDNSCYLIL